MMQLVAKADTPEKQAKIVDDLIYNKTIRINDVDRTDVPITWYNRISVNDGLANTPARSVPKAVAKFKKASFVGANTVSEANGFVNAGNKRA
jgi:hypothetical protein